MATTSNTYTGNGSNKLFSITFPYLETTDIFVFVNGTLTTAYTFANATTIEMTAAPANGATVYIARVTDDTTLQATFFPGSSIKAADLNLDFDQVLYIAQETSNEATTATSTAASATTTANTALSQSSAAVSTANTASSNASAAVSTANTASTNASNAVTTANTASSNATTAVNTANAATSTANTASSNASAAVSTANTASSNASAAVSTANTASTNASAAVSTANTASTNASTAVTTANNAVTTANSAVTTANSAVTTANTANTNSNTAVTTANAAAAAVANAVLYTTVANVAAIPGSPANNAAVEVTNSTGIESFTPLSGLPAGFIGSSGLSVRIIYQTSGATWTWIQYFPNDPETRYLKLAGGTLTGALAHPLGAAATPSITFTGDTNTGIYSPGADQLAVTTGGTGRLFVDASGNVALGAAAFSKPFTISNQNAAISLRANSTGTYSDQGIFFAVDATNYAQIYNDGPGTIIFRNGPGLTERLRISTTGLVGIGTASPVNNLDIFSTSNTQIAASTNNPASIAGLTLSQLGSGASSFVVRAGSNYTILGTITNTPVLFTANNLERMRIDGSGRLLVGTSTSITTLIAAGLQVQSTGATAYASIGRWDNNAANPGLILNKSRGGSVGTLGVVQINDSLGEINFQGDDGSAFVAAARIQAQVDGTPGTNDMPGRLVFATTADGASSLTERMRIDSSGRVGIGTTNPGVTLDVRGNASIGTQDANTVTLELGGGATGDRAVLIDLVGDTTYTDYGARFIRTSGGANGNTNLLHRGTGNLNISAIDAGAIALNTSNTERARIDASGRLLVGTSSAVASFYGTTPTRLSIATTAGCQLVETVGAAHAFGSRIDLYKTRGATSGSAGIVQAGDEFGSFTFGGSDGVGPIPGAVISAIVDGTPGTNDMPGRLVFSTTADGASSPTERFRISSTGAQSSVIPGGSTLYPSFACRAWVNFDGTTASPSTIRGSGNVSSVTKVSTGVYQVNYSVAMPDANYSVTGSTSTTSGSVGVIGSDPTATDFNKTTGAVTVVTYDSSAENAIDRSSVNVAIFR